MSEAIFSDLSEISRRTGVPKQELERIVRELVKAYDPLRIYLFGSFSWGSPHWNSDLDFCCIVRTDEEAEDHDKEDEVFGSFTTHYTDFYLCSKNEFEKFLSNPATMEHKIFHEANVLYAAADVVFDHNQPLYREELDILKKAGHCLDVSTTFFEKGYDYVDIILHHVQQCIEFSLRAFRMFHLQQIMKTHKLLLLRQVCGRIEPKLKEIEGFSSHASKRITRYYWLRYNKKVKIPVNIAGVEKEIAIAGRVYEFVKHYIETTEPPLEPTVFEDMIEESEEDNVENE